MAKNQQVTGDTGEAATAPDRCVWPTGRLKSTPPMMTLEDVCLEVQRVYREFRAGRLDRQDFRDLINGCRVAKECLKEKTLGQLAYEIELLKEKAKREPNGGVEETSPKNGGQNHADTNQPCSE